MSKKLKNNIEKLRKDLYKLINEEDNINNKKILQKSQKLDKLLNKYEEKKNN